MLKGKIISVEALEMGKFKLIIDKKTKIFDNYGQMNSFLIKTLEKAKDKSKKAVLQEDLSKYFRKIPKF